MFDKKLLAGGSVLLVAAAFWFYIKPSFLDAGEPAEYTEEQLAEAPRPTLTLEERVLNLKAPSATPNYVKLVLALEFQDPDHAWVGLEGDALAEKNEEFSAELEPEVHRIWDAVTSVVGSHTLDEVVTAEGREQLKDELRTAINAELHGHAVEDVYFVTFVTQ